MEAGPQEVARALKRQSEVTNTPRIGDANNYAFGTMQLNIGATKTAQALERVGACLHDVSLILSSNGNLQRQNSRKTLEDLLGNTLTKAMVLVVSQL